MQFFDCKFQLAARQAHFLRLMRENHARQPLMAAGFDCLRIMHLMVV
jgi:hypothetical protein